MSLAKLFDLTWTAIRYRLFRALMTVLVITVAIAFAVNLLLGAVNARIVRQNTEEELEQHKSVSRWASRISQSLNKDLALAEFVSAARSEELIGFAGISKEQFTSLSEVAGQGLAFIEFLETLQYKERRELVGAVVNVSFLDELVDGDRRSGFLEMLSQFPAVRLKMSLEEFEAMLENWVEVSHTLDVFVANRNEALRSLLPLFGSKSPIQVLAEGRDELLNRLNEIGFQIEPEEYRQVVALAKTEALAIHLENSFTQLDLKKALARRLNTMPYQIEASRVWRSLQKQRNAEWYLQNYQELADNKVEWSATDAVFIARQRLREAKLQDAYNATIDAKDTRGLFGLSVKMSVLLIVSLAVCGVGITNALLMSVTERYREIATLKCLGALDVSILLIFVIEASLQGVVGGLAGSLIGGLTSFLGALLSFGSIFLQEAPIFEMFKVFLLALIGGALLAGAAAVYPSWKAARLAPLEAMRIE